MPPQNSSEGSSGQRTNTVLQLRLDSVRQWSSKLPADANDFNTQGYITTGGYTRALHKVLHGRGGLLALVGTQGVGKSVTLHRLAYFLKEVSKRKVLLITWSDPNDQIRELLNYGFLSPVDKTPFAELRRNFNSTYRTFLRIAVQREGYDPVKLPEGVTISNDIRSFDADWAEKQLGRSFCSKLQEQVWFMVVRSADVVLIDLPDYARTDKRLMTRHLNELYLLWNRSHEYPSPPTLVIAIQKEMLQGHFFYDKMEKVEIQPVTAEELVQSYVATFQSSYPFDDSALLQLARLSRGIYRHFKRYISLTIENWQPLTPYDLITPDFVKKAITFERLADDLNLELEELFPRNADARRDGARIIHHLRSSGPLDQTTLGENLEIPAYTLSRLLSRLESRFVTRKTDGSRKIVSLVDVL